MIVYFYARNPWVKPENCVVKYEAIRANKNCVWLPKERMAGGRTITIEVKHNRRTRDGYFYDTLQECVAAATTYESGLAAWSVSEVTQCDAKITRLNHPGYPQTAIKLPPGVTFADEIGGRVWVLDKTDFTIRSVPVHRTSESSIWLKQEIRIKRNTRSEFYAESLAKTIAEATRLLREQVKSASERLERSQARLAHLRTLEQERGQHG